MIGRKINRRVAIFLVFTLVISMFGAFPGGYAAAAEAETEILTILHTNDIHASIQDFAKVAHYIATERAQSENFLYLDAGDVFSGDPVVDLPKGKPMIELFNKVGLDAMAIGNHEFDYGPENFNLRMNESHFPWLSANMEVVDSIIEQPEPYTIFEMDDFTVGVISLTQAPPATSPKNVAGVEFHDYNETVEQYLSLRDEVDVLVGLTHIGFAEDQHLAREFDIFDVIIGGHSHTALSQASVVNGTTIVQTGSHLNSVGHLTIEINKVKKQVTNVDWTVKPVSSMTEMDEEVQQMVDGYYADVEDIMSEVIGQSETGLSSVGKSSRDVPLGNFWTDAMRHVHDGDIAVTNGGGIRDSIAPGEITVGDIFRVEPFANQVMIIEMTGQAIKDVIEYSYTREGRNQIDLQTSGLHYTIITNSAGGYVDAELTLAGEPLDMDATYTVIAPDYIGSGGSGYDFQGNVIAYEAGLMTDAMIEYAAFLMDTAGVINYETEGRIKKEQTDSPPVDGPAITVEEAIANNSGTALVEGYIVGHVEGASFSGRNFEAPFANDYNFLLADSPDERDPNKLLPVQITSPYRSQFGLATNPDLLGKKIKVAGSLEPYFGVPGLKDPQSIVVSDDEQPPGLGESISVAEAIANNEGEAVVEGYVVGHAAGSMNNINFEPPYAGASNIVIADDPGERDKRNLLPVQLPSGNKVRDVLNLVDNPDLLGKKIKVQGSLETYFGQSGLKNPKDAEIVPELQVLTIAEAREQPLGQQVITEGVVTTVPGAWGTKAFYIQDASGGILVYQHNFDVEQGDYVRVNGTLKDFNGEIELDPVTNVEVLKKNQPLPDPQQLTPGQVARDNQGQLVSLAGVTISDLQQVTDFGTFEFTASDGVESVLVRVDDRTGLSFSNFEFSNGDVVNITGISSEFRGTFQVKPRYASDIVAAEDPGDGDVDIPLIRQTVVDFRDSGDIQGTFAAELIYRLDIVQILLNQGATQVADAYLEDFLRHINDLAVRQQGLISEIAREDLEQKINAFRAFMLANPL